MVSCVSSETPRPTSSAPSGETQNESTRSALRARTPSSTSASTAHGGRSSIASCTLATTGSRARLRGGAQPAIASRSARSTATTARPSASPARAAIVSASASNRARHSSALPCRRASSAPTRSASDAFGRDSRRARSRRSTIRRTTGSAAGLEGGAGSASIASRTSAAGNANPPRFAPGPGTGGRSRVITASRTSSAHARSRSSSAASIAADARAPSGVRRPSRIADHTAAPRGRTGSTNIASANAGSTSSAQPSTGESSSPSCHADTRIAATASPASSSTNRSASGFRPGAPSASTVTPAAAATPPPTPTLSPAPTHAHPHASTHAATRGIRHLFAHDPMLRPLSSGREHTREIAPSPIQRHFCRAVSPTGRFTRSRDGFRHARRRARAPSPAVRPARTASACSAGAAGAHPTG